jgi:hypothetical protein
MDITLRSRRPLIGTHNGNVSHPRCVAVTSPLCTQSHCATHCRSCRETTKGSTTRDPRARDARAARATYTTPSWRRCLQGGVVSIVWANTKPFSQASVEKSTIVVTHPVSSLSPTEAQPPIRKRTPAARQCCRSFRAHVPRGVGAHKYHLRRGTSTRPSGGSLTK